MLGDRIAQLRSRLGWSQAELAKRLNISSSAVGMYEQGRREPSVEMLITLSGILGVSVDYLLTGRILCRSDRKVATEICVGNGVKPSPVDFLKKLSREELMVLLTASLLGGEEA